MGTFDDSEKNDDLHWYNIIYNIILLVADSVNGKYFVIFPIPSLFRAVYGLDPTKWYDARQPASGNLSL